jgi:hypothetical protein
MLQQPQQPLPSSSSSEQRADERTPGVLLSVLTRSYEANVRFFDLWTHQLLRSLGFRLTFLLAFPLCVVCHA